MTARRSLAVTIVLLATAASAGAQQPAPLALTVDEAVARGLAHAPSIAEAGARLAAADAGVRARRAAGLPSASVVSSYLRTNHVDEFGVPQPDGGFRILFPDLPSNYRVRGELTVPIYSSGRWRALVDAAEAERTSVDADRRAIDADVRLEVTRTYWALVTAREAARVLQRALERTDAWVADVKARVDAGLLPPNDVLSAQAQRARQSVRLIQAQNDAASSEMDLARLIGVDLTARIEPTSRADAPEGPGALAREPAESLVARALEGRPERAALLGRRASLGLTADAALASIRPQVGAVAAVEPARPNARFVPRTDEWRTSWDLGVTVGWTIFDGGRARADAAAARAQADAIDQRLRDLDARVAIDVRQRLLDLASVRAAQAAADEAIAAATEAHRVVLERFRAGVATSTDVLDAEVALLEAELERTRLDAALRLGEARLARAVGGRP
jgi:outer membrane protein